MSEHTGLIERSQEAQWRPAQLQAAPLEDAFQWLEACRQNWEENLERLAKQTGGIQKCLPPQVNTLSQS